MKKLAQFYQGNLVRILSCLLVVAAVACSDTILDEPLGSDLVSNGQEVELEGLLNQLDFDSGIIIVQEDGSIQDAINAAMPGDVIYIEPGIYKEALTIEKPGIELIGLSNSIDGEIILENPENANKGFKGEGVKISKPKTREKSRRSLLRKMTRNDLGDGIAHYEFEICLGDREFDVVRLHRVVREYRPYHPVHTKGDIFMIHGSIQDFDDIFLTAGAENLNVQTSSPIYLASKNIDVWGIDLGWTFIPKETTDFTFMQDWGVDRDIDHTMAAMTVARLIRSFTSHNFGRMNLLGFSYSVMVAYGAAGRESQGHRVFHNIKGLIPVDHLMKYAPSDEELRLEACASAVKGKEHLENGNYVNNGGVTFAALGNLALAAPDDPSPIPDFAGLTNFQVMLLLGANTYLTGSSAAPFWHFMGGDLQGLYYADANRWLRVAVSLAPYQPRLQGYEGNVCLCDEEDVSFDDYLGDITVPILYLGAGGGMGTYGEYTSSLTASNDITHYYVTVNEDRKLDYGHADLFLGENADELAWERMYNWLIDHSKR